MIYNDAPHSQAISSPIDAEQTPLVRDPADGGGPHSLVGAGDAPLTLHAQHLEMLTQGSAITEDIIRTRGYRSLTHPDDLCDLGFSKVQARTAPVLAIPLWDVHGQQTAWQIRPDTPASRQPGRPSSTKTPKAAD